MELSVVTNYNYATRPDGCVTHLFDEDSGKTLCGIRVSSRHGDWQETGANPKDVVGCKKCTVVRIKREGNGRKMS